MNEFVPRACDHAPRYLVVSGAESLRQLLDCLADHAKAPQKSSFQYFRLKKRLKSQGFRVVTKKMDLIHDVEEIFTGGHLPPR